ncbi:chorion peroxidase [Eupeodes corollae]|uniref:chorion peroxidase n=1 Tax=Eupeodes corollae TaxID=290404 RepID=UPI002493564E|nr:chorion peroxidase [Eupeodes corollae]
MENSVLSLFYFAIIVSQFTYFISPYSISGYRTVDETPENDNENYKSSPMLSTECDPCPIGIECVPQIQCPAHVLMENHEKPQVCDLSGGKFGFCCLTGQNHSISKDQTPRFARFSGLTDDILEKARAKFAKIMQSTVGAAVKKGHPDFLHNIVFHSNPQEDIEGFHISASAMQEVITSQIFREIEHIPVEDFETNSIKVDFKTSPMAQHCTSPFACSDIQAKYRSLSGTCNNPIPHRSMWGAAGQPMERLLPPAYEDGVWLPRVHSVDGSPLMGAREISRTLLLDSNRPHPKHNLLVMQFGQFLAHDVTQSSSIRLENGEAIECCAQDGSGPLPPHQSHFACMPIPVEPNDEFYGHFNQRCINFVRLSLAPNTECRMGYAKQRSKVTHFLDASPVYGSTSPSASILRTFRGGKLRMFDDFGRDLLPLTNEKESCASNENGNVCFKSGDGRTNQIISLIAIHILFAREHNRLAEALARINPHLNDETLYQEARRIVIAEIQHIVYNEYLPIVVGPKQMQRFRIATQHQGYANDYSTEVNPAVTNEFTGAAFRFGHSTVDGKFHVHSSNGVDEVIDIPDVMFNPSRMRKRSFYDAILNTMLDQPMQKVDGSITHGLSRFLFRGANPFGLDLAALNIQRGRDHALRSYNHYLHASGQRIIHSFSQFSPDVARKLSQVYRHPDDIDLWVGGLLEPHVHEALVGQTFSDIIADQFSRLRHGDRYFYEYGPNINPGAFTASQLNEIRKSSFARIICDNSDRIGIFEVSPAAFVRPDYTGNQKIRCDKAAIPSMDLRFWRI